eukprot:SAG11_NODE_6522_length_1296_cov_1.545530_1_plen_155_part_10
MAKQLAALVGPERAALVGFAAKKTLYTPVQATPLPTSPADAQLPGAEVQAEAAVLSASLHRQQAESEDLRTQLQEAVGAREQLADALAWCERCHRFPTARPVGSFHILTRPDALAFKLNAPVMCGDPSTTVMAQARGADRSRGAGVEDGGRPRGR